MQTMSFAFLLRSQAVPEAHGVKSGTWKAKLHLPSILSSEGIDARPPFSWKQVAATANRFGQVELVRSDTEKAQLAATHFVHSIFLGRCHQNET